jgi:hypothetical protein
MMTPPDQMNPMQIPPDAVTYHKDVRGIIEAHCQGCHKTGGIAPFALESYDDAKNWAGPIVRYTSQRLMPPWGAFETDQCHPPFSFQNDIRLSDAQIKAFADWNAGGMIEGDPATAPQETPPVNSTSLSRVDVEMKPDMGWTTSGSVDQFRCFVLDPHWTKDQYLAGANVVAGNPRVVHHAIAFLDVNRESLAKVDPQTGSYECFGSPGLSSTEVLEAWAPGVPPLELGSLVGIQVPANALVVLQIHYHPLASSTPEHDQTTVQLRASDATPPWVMKILLIGNFDSQDPNGDGLLPGPDDPGGKPTFLIPAGATAHTESMQFTLPMNLNSGARVPNLKVLTVGTHMHYVGTDMRFEIQHASPQPGEPASQCMVDTPHWNFHWQRGYAYDTSIDNAPEWRPLDKLLMQCTYNNSTSNPWVVAALQEQGLTAPRDVVLGEQTLDEMCLAVLGVAYKNPSFTPN